MWGTRWTYSGRGFLFLLLFLEKCFDGYRLSPVDHDRGVWEITTIGVSNGPWFTPTLFSRGGRPTTLHAAFRAFVDVCADLVRAKVRRAQGGIYASYEIRQPLIIANHPGSTSSNTYDTSLTMQQCFDVAYGFDQLHRFDAFVPANHKSKCIVFVHGGAWRS